MDKKSEHGNIIEIVIIGVLVLVIAGLIVWRFLDNKNTSASNSTSTQQQAVNSVDTAKTNITQAPVQSTTSQQVAEPGANGKYSAEQVTSHVNSTYATYIELRKKGQSVQQSLQSIQGAFTSSVYTSLVNTSGSEGLTCASNYIPDNVDVSTVISGGQGVSSVTRNYQEQAASAKIIVISDISTDIITGVQCP